MNALQTEWGKILHFEIVTDLLQSISSKRFKLQQNFISKMLVVLKQFFHLFIIELNLKYLNLVYFTVAVLAISVGFHSAESYEIILNVVEVIVGIEYP